ncbi:MAG: zinc carboxypeptidase [Deltaproteobacteria bacterium]|nr:zinc carboxypeptidase [Deltaproteobacteria bacterium]
MTTVPRLPMTLMPAISTPRATQTPLPIVKQALDSFKPAATQRQLIAAATPQLRPPVQRFAESPPTQTTAPEAADKTDTNMSTPDTDTRVWFTLSNTTRDSRTLIEEMGGAIEYVAGDYVEGVATQETLKRMLDAGMMVQYELLSSIKYKSFPEKDAVYHDYAETNQLLNDLVKERPDLVTLITIGQTVEGKKIYGLRFKQGAAVKPGVVFVGSHHAREHLSTEIPLLLAQYLVKNADKPEIARLLSERDITIIPMLNADGAEYDIEGAKYHTWRKNRSQNKDGSKGVDLNRNYGYKWGGKGSSGDPGSETYRGTSAFSEPEAKAFKEFVEANPNIKIMLTYHTFSELILYPWGHTSSPIENAKDHKIFRAMATKMAQWTGYTPQQSSDLYITTGDTTDWAYGALGIYAFTFELSPKTGWAGGFYPGDIIGPTFEKNIQSALFLIDAADNPAKVVDPGPSGV